MGINKRDERIGQTTYNKQDIQMKIIKYNNAHDIDVIFEDGYIYRNKSYKEFHNKSISHPNYYKNLYIGETKTNNQGLLMEIIEYNNAKDINVEFEDGIVIEHCRLSHFYDGNIKNKNFPFLYNRGFLGYGKYKPIIKKEQTIEYKKWTSMFRRCYNKKGLIRQPTYQGCEVCKEWYNFQVFAKWYNENLWSEECNYLDKDILIKDNKIYSPNTCILVDNKINCLFVTHKKHRGVYPIGVCKENNCNSYRATFGAGNYLEFFDNPIDAFYGYKNAKEKYFKKIANDYKEKYKNFPIELYNALINYEVSIDD